MRICPKGLPLALKIKEVAPKSEAVSVSIPPRSKRKKDKRIILQEKLHSRISFFVKYAGFFFMIFSLHK